MKFKMKNRQLQLAAETKERRDKMQNQRTMAISVGQLIPQLSLGGLLDLLETVGSQLELLGAWPFLCSRELIGAIQEWDARQ